MKLASIVSIFCLAATAGADDNFFLRGNGNGNGQVNGNGNGNNGKNDEVKINLRQAAIDYWKVPGRVKQAKPRHMFVDERPGHERPGNSGKGARKLQTTVKDEDWNLGGHVHEAAGRLLFTMGGRDYLCSATAVTDGSATNGRSIILTAGHCVYDDSSKKFATNFLFIPNQDDDGTDSSDWDPSNDPFGAWAPSFAVVDVDWAGRTWSSNIPADYAMLVVDDNDANAHQQGYLEGVDSKLDQAVNALDVSFSVPVMSGTSHALGYSGSQDPNFRHCVQLLQEESNAGGYLLDGCGLTGGSSGGPWIKNMDNTNGRGEVIAVNSYGPRNGKPYMGGPRLYDNSAQCLYEKALSVQESDAAGGGIIVTYNGDCDAATVVSGDAFNGGGGGPNPNPNQCAADYCVATPSSYDELCCAQLGPNRYATKVRGPNVWCGTC